MTNPPTSNHVLFVLEGGTLGYSTYQYVAESFGLRLELLSTSEIPITHSIVNTLEEAAKEIKEKKYPVTVAFMSSGARRIAQQLWDMRLPEVRVIVLTGHTALHKLLGEKADGPSLFDPLMAALPENILNVFLPHFKPAETQRTDTS